MCFRTVARVAISVCYWLNRGASKENVHSRIQRTCRCRRAVQGRPGRRDASLGGLVGGRWHLSLREQYRWSGSLVSFIGGIVSQTWRRARERSTTDCVAFELAEERHSTLGAYASKSGRARLCNAGPRASNWPDLSAVNTRLVSWRGRMSTRAVGASGCDGSKTWWIRRQDDYEYSSSAERERFVQKAEDSRGNCPPTAKALDSVTRVPRGKSGARCAGEGLDQSLFRPVSVACNSARSTTAPP